MFIQVGKFIRDCKVYELEKYVGRLKSNIALQAQK